MVARRGSAGAGFDFPLSASSPQVSPWPGALWPAHAEIPGKAGSKTVVLNFQAIMLPLVNLFSSFPQLMIFFLSYSTAASLG